MASKTRVLAMVAALATSNAAFRVALIDGPPNIKPTAFLVIVGGIVGGAMPGAAIGCLSMALSDLVIGAGVWTIETSTGMAVVGFLAALFWHKVNPLKRWSMVVGGFMLTMIFDVWTSIVNAPLFNVPWWISVAALYVPFLFGGFSLYPFGLVHELTTATLLSVIGPSLVTRLRKVYH